MIRLSIAPGTIAGAVAVALEEAALDWSPVLVDFASAEQTSPAYLAKNPKGRVPLLETADGALTETGAILEHIAALAPEAGLVPDDALQRARMREAMYYFASTMHVAHAHKLRGARWADRAESWEDMRAKIPQTMAACCAHVEDHVLEGPFVLGERLCLADPYLFVITTWLPGDGVDIARYPRLAAFRETMEARPSVVRVRALGLI